jgi:hypothetical protein
MTAFPVNPDKAQQLAQRMAALGVRESDIEETFVRSGGHGQLCSAGLVLMAWAGRRGALGAVLCQL